MKTKKCSFCLKRKKVINFYPKSGRCKPCFNSISSENNFNGNRMATIKRDGFTCQVCHGMSNLVVHHKDCSEWGSENRNNDIDNLITVCRACHPKLHNRWKGHTFPRVIKNCLHCKKELRVIPALANRKNYCSRSCSTIHRNPVLVRWANRVSKTWKDAGV